MVQDQARAARMHIVDLRTAESMDFQYNPAEVSEKLSVNYAKPEILGLSHKPLQYTSTDNLDLRFELAFDELSQLERRYDVRAARQFLHSLCYPPKAVGSISGGAPPECLFVWPELYTLRVRILSVEGKATRFFPSLRPSLWSFQISIIEAPIERITSEDARAFGTLRSLVSPEFF